MLPAIFHRLTLDGEPLMSESVHEKLGDKRHEHALCRMKKKVQYEDQTGGSDELDI